MDTGWEERPQGLRSGVAWQELGAAGQEQGWWQCWCHHSSPQGAVEGTAADCLVPFLLRAGNTWPGQRQGWGDHLKRKEVSLPASSQHTLVRGGATGSLLQNPLLVQPPGAAPWHFHLLQSFQSFFRRGEAGSVHSAWVGKQSPFALNHGPSLQPHTRHGRGGWGCNKSREGL